MPQGRKKKEITQLVVSPNGTIGTVERITRLWIDHGRKSMEQWPLLVSKKMTPQSSSATSISDELDSKGKRVEENKQEVKIKQSDEDFTEEPK